MSLGDRVAVLRGGVLQQVGTPRAVYSLPENVFVAAFIGTPRINLLRGLVRAPLDGAMTISLGKQFLRLPEPLSLDHQLLRVQQGREVIVGLRSEAVRIAKPSAARPGRWPSPAWWSTWVPGPRGAGALRHRLPPRRRPRAGGPAPGPRPSGARRRRREAATVLERLRERAGALRAGAVRTGSGRPGALATLDAPGRPNGPGGPGPAGAPSAQVPAPTSADPRVPGDLIVRTTPDIRLRHGMQVPLLVDLAHLFVFDQHGRRICPSPDRLPDLEE